MKRLLLLLVATTAAQATACCSDLSNACCVSCHLGISAVDFCSHQGTTTLGCPGSLDTRPGAPVCKTKKCDSAANDGSCCKSTNPCDFGEGDCDKDSDCATGVCRHDIGDKFGFSASWDVCGKICDAAANDGSCCRAKNPCNAEEGDCDYDADCATGVCRHDVGSYYGFNAAWDVCGKKCDAAANDSSCCTKRNPCNVGEGDCDKDSDCATGVCRHDVAGSYGFATASWDVCGKKCDAAAKDSSCCTSKNPCNAGEGDCDKDSDCATGVCRHNVAGHYGFADASWDVCGKKCDAAAKDASCCTSKNPCNAGEGDCDKDSDCATGVCRQNVAGHYGFADASWDVCGKKCDAAANDSSCCTSKNPCNAGEGDCDSDSDCAGSLVCRHDVAGDFGFSNASWDVCGKKCDAAANDASCCTKSNPCNSGEGDCDSDKDCASSLYCCHDIGANYGFKATWDVCCSVNICAAMKDQLSSLECSTWPANNLCNGATATFCEQTCCLNGFLGGR